MPEVSSTDVESSVAKATSAVPTAPAYLQKLLAEIAAREGFADGYAVNTVSGSNAGDGFQAIMLRTSIVGRRNGVNNQRLELICKVPPQSDLRRQMAAPSFRCEVFAYDSLLPTFTQMQMDKCIAPADGFYSFPKCYGTYCNDETMEYAVVLEDLKARDFRMRNGSEAIDFAHVKLVLAQLGRYHALSFALREQRPALLASYAKRKGMLFIMQSPATDAFYRSTLNRAIDLVSDDEVELKERMTSMRKNYMDVIGKVATGKLAEPFAVLCHGDCWNNNMMFEYEKDDNKVAKSVCLIDWQLVQYCSPATDLSYYIYTSTEQGLRREQFDDMLTVYHESLTTLLTQLGCDAGQMFGFETFTEQLRDFAIYTMILAPMVMQFITVNPSDIPDMDAIDPNGSSIVDFVGENNSVYVKRMLELMRDFNERGFFDSKHNQY